ncbi:MAG: 2-amino-4-hydroxy-6-hydroxymethyldihydropteridine diphosphokinase [Parachlamydiales bacterium]|jgi:2-amino-4-hydroxy-6-hydroxymethyldihydropteridine diphosphokinase
MHKVFIGVGANLGNPQETIAAAERILVKNGAIKAFNSSKLYLTTPVSDIPQPDYLNCAWAFETTLNPLQLLDLLQSIEKELGKIDKPKNAPRLIDLDILLYDDIAYNQPELCIPHPCWKERAFVLIPLVELAHEVKMADGTQLNIQELIAKLPQEALQGVALYNNGHRHAYS